MKSQVFRKSKQRKHMDDRQYNVCRGTNTLKRTVQFLSFKIFHHSSPINRSRFWRNSSTTRSFNATILQFKHSQCDPQIANALGLLYSPSFVSKVDILTNRKWKIEPEVDSIVQTSRPKVVLNYHFQAPKIAHKKRSFCSQWLKISFPLKTFVLIKRIF